MERQLQGYVSKGEGISQAYCLLQGILFYSSRPLLGLEQQNLPATLVDGQTSEGDVLRVVNVQCFTLPAEMKSGAATSTGTGVSMDRRCAN